MDKNDIYLLTDSIDDLLNPNHSQSQSHSNSQHKQSYTTSYTTSNNGGMSRQNSSPQKIASSALRQQEQILDNLQKENFALKIRVYYLEDQLGNISPNQNLNDAYKENVELKLEIEKLRRDLEQSNKEKQQVLSSSGSGGNNSSSDNEEIQELKNENVKLKQELSKQQQQISQLEKEKQRPRSVSPYNNNYNTNVSGNASGNASVTAANEILEKTLIQYRQQIQSLEDEIGKCKNRINEQNLKLAENGVEIEKLRGINDSLTFQLQHNTTLEQEHNTSTAGEGDIDEILGGILDRSSTVGGGGIGRGERSWSNTQLENGIQILRDQISQLKLQIIHIQSTNQQLQSDINQERVSKEREIHRMKEVGMREVEKLKSVLREKSQEVESMKKELCRMRGEVEEKESMMVEEGVRSQMEVQTLEQSIKSQKLELDRLGEENELLNSKNRKNEEEMMKKEMRVEELVKEVELQKKRIVELEKSHDLSMHQMTVEMETLKKELCEKQRVLEVKNEEVNTLRHTSDNQKQKIQELENQLFQLNRQYTQHNTSIQTELDSQIQQFNLRIQQLSRTVGERERELQEVKGVLEMHSVGLEEATLLYQRDREKYIERMKELETELEICQQELSRKGDEKVEWERQFSDVVSVNEKLKYTNQLLENKNIQLTHAVKELEERLSQKEKLVRERVLEVQRLKERVEEFERREVETIEGVKRVEGRLLERVGEREELLLQVRDSLKRILTGGSTADNTAGSSTKTKGDRPSDNFYSFKQQLLSTLEQLSKLKHTFEQQLKHFTNDKNEQLNTLRKRLDKKMEQLEKFEHIVRDAITVQHKLKSQLQQTKSSLKNTEKECQLIKQEVIRKDLELSKVNSEVLIVNTKEREKLKHAQLKISELESLIKRERVLFEETKETLKEYESQLENERKVGEKRVREMSERESRLKGEIEVSHQQIRHLENILKSRDSKVYSEQSLVQMNEKLQNELQHLKDTITQLKKEISSKNEILEKYQKEREQMKKRLEKREEMIQMALSKLELVNGRRQRVEEVVLETYRGGGKKGEFGEGLGLERSGLERSGLERSGLERSGSDLLGKFERRESERF